MKNLDDVKKINKLDVQGMRRSIESISLQCQQAWDEVKKIKVPKSYFKVDNILINGMGGSGLGGHIIDSLFGLSLRVPFKVINSYKLPDFVNSRSLYIISSYSGTTEEPVGTFKEAVKRKVKIMAIASGGTLVSLARRHRKPYYAFEPRFNPCGQPRMGLGYSIIGQVAMLKKCGLLKITDREFNKAIQYSISLHKKYGLKIVTRDNIAKKMAHKIYNRIPIIIGAEHLIGNAHAMANQINENSKNFSAYHIIPELNHHLMEGVQFPRSNANNLSFVFIESSLYMPKVQKRFKITQQVLKKNNIPYVIYTALGKTRLDQVIGTLLFGSYMNFYLAILNNLDPSPIPYVDYFKEQLKKK